MTMYCEDFDKQLDDYLDGALEPDERSRVEDHIGQCERCASAASGARRLQRALAGYPVSPPSPGFADRVVRDAVVPRRRKGGGRLIAAAFVATFVLSVATVIYTGLAVKAPNTELSAGLPAVAMQVDEARTVNLVFSARSVLDDVTLLVSLPEGVELAGYPGQRDIEWRTGLVAGRNVLPLELIATDQTAGQLVAQLVHGDQRKVFRVYLDVGPG